MVVLEDEPTVLKSKKSSKGIASAYANPSLIPMEQTAIEQAFSGE